MRKGQAAMEFLMTYGWAILVVLAAIAALAYFGVLSPDKFLPDKCTANPPFSCTEYKLDATTTNITIQNNAGSDIMIRAIALSCDANTWTDNTTTTGNDLVVNGNKIAVTFDASLGNCGTLATGDKFKANYKIYYTKSGESSEHEGSGSIQARVE